MKRPVQSFSKAARVSTSAAIGLGAATVAPTAQAAPHGEFAPTSCAQAKGTQPSIDSIGFDFDCGVYDYSCDPQNFSYTPQNVESAPRTVAFVFDTGASFPLSGSSDTVAANIAGLFTMFSATRGTEVQAYSYQQRMTCRWATAWGYTGWHKHAYKRSRGERCRKWYSIQGPISAVWHGEWYYCY